MYFEPIYHDETERLNELFVGRKVVSVDEGASTLTLDDGTVFDVIPNHGCGGCTSGWYRLDALNTWDNVIMGVSVVSSDTTDDWGWGGGTQYDLFVYAENGDIGNVVTVSGSDGNGYYGTGFAIRVRRNVH